MTDPVRFRTRREIHETITDRFTKKQGTALETAYFAGYCDWPRASTGEEIAETLGVSAPTFARHLRTASENSSAAATTNREGKDRSDARTRRRRSAEQAG